MLTLRASERVRERERERENGLVGPDLSVLCRSVSDWSD